MSVRRWLPALGIALAAALFAWWNRGERVVVDAGLFRVYRAPLTLVVLGAFLAGMLSMLLLSLRHDRRVRDELRARGLLEPAPARAAAPIASAWGVAREPAPRTHERTAHPRLDEDSSGGEDRAAGYPRLEDEDRGEGERTVAFPGLEGPRDGEDRTIAYPRLEEERGDDGRTVSYPRRDEDPAA